MRIDLDIRDHEVLGPMFIEAEQTGLQRGLQRGLHAGELTVLRRQIGKRFGALPGWAGEKLAALSTFGPEDLKRAAAGREKPGRIAGVTAAGRDRNADRILAARLVP